MPLAGTFPVQATPGPVVQTPATSTFLSFASLRQALPVPMAPVPGRFDIETVAVEGDALLIDVRAPESAYLDLFADPPADWFIRCRALSS